MYSNLQLSLWYHNIRCVLVINSGCTGLGIPEILDIVMRFFISQGIPESPRNIMEFFHQGLSIFKVDNLDFLFS